MRRGSGTDISFALFVGNAERAEGRAEGFMEVAKKMLDKGMSAEVVADMTGLSLDEVFKLKQ